MLDRLVTPDTDLLDVGCGSGRFCVLARERGARVAGIDATPELLSIGRERNPDADLRGGDLQFLPWEDESFDVVTGFNAFFYAADIVGVPRGRARAPSRRPRGAHGLRAT